MALVLTGCVGSVSGNPNTAPTQPSTPPSTPPAVSVSVAPTTPTVQLSQTKGFTATVSNDSQKKGVTWALSGKGCSGATCGTLSASSSASGVAITYTAPAAMPAPPAVALTATSVADGTKSATATITLTAPPAISVSVSPTTGNVLAGGTLMFTATLQNDSQNKGVAWSLAGTGCSAAACGTVSPGSSLSGTSVTYTAPMVAPSGTVTVTATSSVDSTKSAAAVITVTPLPIAVTVAPAAASVQVGTTEQFTATVQNDAQNKGVTWQLLGSSCEDFGCGTLSATSSPSGLAITYTAPTTVPTPAAITLRATSVTDSTKTAAAIVSITGAPAITVAVSPKTANVATNGTHAFTATVGNDMQNKGVTWTLSGAGCSGATCGILSSNSSPSGTAITYTAPGSVPNPAAVTITATSVQDETKSATASVMITASPAPVIDFGTGQDPNLAIDTNGNLDLSWIQTGSTGNVIFARSSDGGATFTTEPVTQPGTVPFVEMAVDGQGTVNLLWQAVSGTNISTVFGNSTDGKAFALTDISSLVSVGTESAIPQLSVSASGLIDVSQLGVLPGFAQGVFSTVLTVSNGTVQPQPTVEVGSNVQDVDGDVIAAAGPQGQIYVAWQMQSNITAECAIMFSRSLDGGMTFSTPLNVSNDPTECAQFPQMFVDSTGMLNLAWTTLGRSSDNNGPLTNPNELYFARSTDQGATFSTPVPLVGINQFTGMGPDASAVGDPQIAVEANGAIAVVFDAATTTDLIALFTRSTDGGATFGTPVTLATGGANSPTIAIDSCGGIDVAWAGGSDVFFTRSTDGATFAPATNLSNAQKSEFSPAIATNANGSAYVVWEDLSNIFFRQVTVCQ